MDLVFRLFSALWWSYFVGSSALLFVGALLIWLVTLPFDRSGRVLHLYSCFWAAFYLYTNPFWRVTVEGVRKVDRSKPYIIVANHQSLADILVLFATYLPFKWVSKAVVFKVPFLGWNMYLNRYVGLVRGDKASVERMAATCQGWLARGVSVMMFPEGTRSPDEQLLPFKPGAFRIARDAKVQVLPVVINGTADVLPKHAPFLLKHYARCTVRVLDPFDIGHYATVEAAADAVRAVFERELATLRGTHVALKSDLHAA